MTFILVPINVILVYLLGAFIEWDLNAGNWSADDRFCVAMFMAFAFVSSAMAASQIEATK